MKVTFKNVEKKYGKTHAVKDFNLEIESGALHFLLGPSGCGKTTTLRMLAGLETVTSGQIFFDETDVTNLAAAERGIGMVFQNYALWPHMSVLKNIEYGLIVQKFPAAERKKRLADVLEITRLDQYADRMPGQLSGGQQQRVALARALVIKPKVLLLDEPLSNLDAKLRLEMRANISAIHRKTGITTVYVTHDQKEALSMGTDITVMHAGHIMQNGTPKGLYHYPKNTFVAEFIGETNLIDGEYVGKKGDEHIIKTNIGTFHSTKTSLEHLTPRKKVSLSIRPEACTLSSVSVSDRINQFDATINDMSYLGDSEQFFLNTSDNNSFFVTLFNVADHQHKLGDKANIQVDANDVLLLENRKDFGPGT